MKPYLVKIETTKVTEDEIKLRLEHVKGNIKFRNDFHCTLIFAKEYTTIPICNSEIETEGVVKCISKFGDAVVMILETNPETYFEKRNRDLLYVMGSDTERNYIPVICKRENYTPHITLGYSDETGFEEELNDLFVGMKVYFKEEKGKIFG